MTPTNLDVTLAAANPLTDAAAADLPLHDAEAELVGRIIEIPVRKRHASAKGGRRRLVAGLAVATAAVAGVLTLLPSSAHEGGPAPAYAASLVRFANASPLVLLKLPGWHVVYANEETNGFGEMHFVSGPADANGTPRGASFSKTSTLAGRVAQLTWEPGRFGRYLAPGQLSAATGLGVTARHFIGEGNGRNWIDISAQFNYHGRLLEFRATVSDFDAFRRELQALTAVDKYAFLRAMPPSVIDSADTGETVRLMLKGIPLPPGFDAARIRGVRLLIHDRYQLGTAVTGTVACMWIADWNRARHAGNRAMVRRAIAAMATAPTWPILREMARQGGWSGVLIGYAKDMRTGEVQLDAGTPGRPLVPDVNSGLGCGYEWGVNLGPDSRSTRVLQSVPRPPD
jgi:hypothetical protein